MSDVSSRRAPQIEETAQAYAPHVAAEQPPKAPMGSQGGIPGAQTAERMAQRAHEDDSKERAEDFAKHFPGITADVLDARASFSRKPAARQVAVAMATSDPVAQSARAAPYSIQYPCGCRAFSDDQAALPADCPTHSIPPKEAA